MSPLVPAADREHLSRVRASLAQDGLDLAMIGHDRLQLLAYAAAIATGLADQGGWQVLKYDPTQLETLLADLTLARFDGALQTLSGQAARQHDRPLHNCLLFIPDAQNLPPTQLRQLLRLLNGTGHRRLRIVALFSSSALACEAQVAELGTRVARWYLDEAPGHLSDHAVLSATPNHSTRSARRQRSPLSRQHKPVRASFTLAASLMLALLFGPTLWPGKDEVARLFTQTLFSSPTGTNPSAATSTLAGVPVFLPPEKKALDLERIETTGAADILDKAETATDTLNKADAPVTDSGASN
ncbi:MAG: hypothetical protein NTZ96_06590 [Burkholderiales bacterium]|nr:hypothetical protein [Burkholderiales bacterium]